MKRSAEPDPGAPEAPRFGFEVRHVSMGEGSDRWGLLTAEERERNARLVRPVDRAAHQSAHVLVREVAGALVGREASTLELVQTCPDCGASGHGRPSVLGLPELAVSLSHTVTLVEGRAPRITVAAAAVLGRPGGRIGVDVEHFGAAVPASALSATERQLVATGTDPVRFWVAKEAAVKAGLGALGHVGRWSVAQASLAQQPVEQSATRASISSAPTNDGLPGDPHLEWWADEQAIAAVLLPRRAQP